MFLFGGRRSSTRSRLGVRRSGESGSACVFEEGWKEWRGQLTVAGEEDSWRCGVLV
jgi:hypothetical protein